jgi:hypothetical protein
MEESDSYAGHLLPQSLVILSATAPLDLGVYLDADACFN